LTMTWTAPHAVSAEERLIYTLLAQPVTTAVAARREIASLQATLRETSRQQVVLETIVENLTASVIVVDLRTLETIRINRAGMDLLAMREGPENFGSVVERNLVFHPGASERMPREDWPLVRAVTTGRTVRSEMDILRYDGLRIEVDIVATPIRDDSGAITTAMLTFQDLGPMRRAERERLRIQEELISAQAAALVERSTPLIPISDEIVVTPIIGSIDIGRGKLMLDALLQGVSRSHARFAIIDITGVPTIDAQATGALTGAAAALRLLGVEPVLTGLRPEVAQTLVGMGVDLGGIATLGTLQSGIAYANRRMGRRVM
jgi:anti-anti-sigma regulatory factor